MTIRCIYDRKGWWSTMHMLVYIRTDVDRPSAWMAAALVSIGLVAVLGFLGRSVLKWDERIDDYLKFTILFLGIGGFLLQFEYPRELLATVGEGLRSAIRSVAAMVNEDWASSDLSIDTVYTILVAVVIFLLVRRIIRDSQSDSRRIFGWPFLLLVALTAPFFLNGIIGRATNWYVNTIGVGVWNFINPA